LVDQVNELFRHQKEEEFERGRRRVIEWGRGSGIQSEQRAGFVGRA
jgi:hypothetical protein